MKKIRVGVFFGGRSAEHDISIVSAKNVIDNFDKSKYDILPIGIGRDGRFYIGKSAICAAMPAASQSMQDVFEKLPEDVILYSTSSSTKLDEDIRLSIDVAFPVLHGPFGEDGAIQGIFLSFNIPFVGPGMLGSSVCMDKDVSRRLIREAKIPCARSLTFHRYEIEDIKYDDITTRLGNVIFVKPANLGSSIGIYKVRSRGDFNHAIHSAFSYDNKILIEEFIKGKEIECAVLGNEHPAASILGEIIVNSDFYSYEAKYIDKNGASLKIPADIPETVSDKIREIAVKAFKILGCEGMARVDFFVDGDHNIFLNEVNTIPGFTEISMYPKLWEASGISYSELLDKLIELAMARFIRDNKHLS